MSIPEDQYQRTVDFVVRLTPEEKRTLIAYSKFRGQSMSELARTFIFRGVGFHYQELREQGIDPLEQIA